MLYGSRRRQAADLGHLADQSADLRRRLRIFRRLTPAATARLSF